MDHLTTRLKYLLHLYTAVPDCGRADATLLREQFRKDLEPLVAQYGQEAVIEALDKGALIQTNYCRPIWSHPAAISGIST
jgi:hypothetical protein